MQEYQQAIANFRHTCRTCLVLLLHKEFIILRLDLHLATCTLVALEIEDVLTGAAADKHKGACFGLIVTSSVQHSTSTMEVETRYLMIAYKKHCKSAKHIMQTQTHNRIHTDYSCDKFQIWVGP